MKFLWFSFFLSFQIYAANVEKLSQHPTWLRLLHWDGSKSRIDAPSFFISDNGKHNPEEELKATILAFKEKRILKDDPWPLACSFVARYQFLQEMGVSLPSYECNDYQWWREQLRIQSVSMVFSSYYAGNPASIFGHTFLKLNFSKDHQSQLTDYAVTFAANATDNIGVVYAIKGLLGGYQGFYAIDPYYMKINEYVHAESRDLWEYPLQMSSKEIDRLLAHLWELSKKSWSDYWFTDENCSYQLLTLLDVAYDDTHLSEQVSWLVLPTDTLQILRHAKKLGTGSIRPSFSKQMQYRYELVKGNTDDQSNPLVLDALIAKKRFEQLKIKNDEADHKVVTGELLELVKKRSQIKVISPAPPKSWYLKMQDEDPSLAHGPTQVSLSSGTRNHEFTSLLGMRLGLHSSTDAPQGLPWQSEIIYGGLKLRYEDQRLSLDSLDIIRVFSPEPPTHAGHPWSWKVDFGAERALGLPDVFTPRLMGSLGKTYAMAKDLSIYALLGAQGHVQSKLRKGYEVGPNFEVGSIYSGNRWRFQLQGHLFSNIHGDRPLIRAQAKVQTQISRNLEIALQSQYIFNTPYHSLKKSDEYLAMILRHF